MAKTFTTVLWERPRIDYEGASVDQQRALDAIFTLLEENPYADGVTKFYYTRLLPAVMNVYIDEDYSIVYQLVSHDPPNWERWNIEVHSIAFSGSGGA